MSPEERKQALNILENLTSALDSLLKDENGMDIGNNPFSEHARLERTLTVNTILNLFNLSF